MTAYQRPFRKLGLSAAGLSESARANWRIRCRLWLALGFAALLLLPAPVAAQREDASPAKQQAIEDELATLRAELVKAFNTRDLDLLLSYCHPDVIAIWPNNQTAVGHDEVRKVIDELLGSDQPLIASYTTDPVVESRIVLNDGQTVVSRGKLNDEYTLARTNGRKVRLHSNWTITLVKIDGRWLIASFHLSANAFDNEVITLYATMLRYWWGGIGLVAGLVLGVVLGVMFSRRRLRKRNASDTGSAT